MDIIHRGWMLSQYVDIFNCFVS